MQWHIGVDFSRWDEATCHFIQWLSFFLYYYKSSNIMSFEGNESLDLQAITLFLFYSLHTLSNLTSFIFNSSVSNTSPLIYLYIDWLDHRNTHDCLSYASKSHVWLTICPSLQAREDPGFVGYNIPTKIKVSRLASSVSKKTKHYTISRHGKSLLRKCSSFPIEKGFVIEWKASESPKKERISKCSVDIGIYIPWKYSILR